MHKQIRPRASTYHLCQICPAGRGPQEPSASLDQALCFCAAAGLSNSPSQQRKATSAAFGYAILIFNASFQYPLHIHSARRIASLDNRDEGLKGQCALLWRSTLCIHFTLHCGWNTGPVTGISKSPLEATVRQKYNHSVILWFSDAASHFMQLEVL